MKIWYQSATAIGKDKGWDPYERDTKEHLQKVAKKTTQIDIYGLQVVPITYGYRYARCLNTIQFVNNSIRSEEEGYDCFVSGCMGDPGIYEIKEVLHIPSVFISQTAYHFASLLAEKFSIIARTNVIPILERNIESYGMQHKYIPATEGINVTLKEVQSQYQHPDLLIERMQKEAKMLKDRGAGILVICCTILNMILVTNNIKELSGIPYIDSAGTLIKVAELMTEMKQARVSGCGSETPNVLGEELGLARKIYKTLGSSLASLS